MALIEIEVKMEGGAIVQAQPIRVLQATAVMRGRAASMGGRSSQVEERVKINGDK